MLQKIYEFLNFKYPEIKVFLVTLFVIFISGYLAGLIIKICRCMQ